MVTQSELAMRRDFRVGPLRVSPARRHVQMPPSSIHLEPLVMQAFLLLLDARGRVVTRTELFEQVWGGAMVGDDSLNRAIAGVRRIDAELGPGLFDVETIPRTGYRLTGTAVGIPQDDVASASAGANEGAATNVDRRLLIGSAAAVVAATGLGIWRINRPPADPRFDALMDRARQSFRTGRAISDDGATLRLLGQAVALNPKDATAWGLIAYLRAFGADKERPDRMAAMVGMAEQAARTALALDPAEPNALAAEAYLQGSIDGWASFDQKLRRILAIAPNNTLAMSELVAVLQLAGMTRESWHLNQRVLALEPFNPTPNFRKAFKLWIMGRVADSYRAINRASDLWPSDPGVWNARLIILAFTGRPAAARTMLDANPDILGPPAAVAVWRTALTALDDRTAGTIAKAREACVTAAGTAPGLAAHGAMILAALGETDAAFDVTNGFLLSRGKVLVRPPSGSRATWLNRPVWKWTQWLFTPPAAVMRADPRFPTLCGDIGLTDYWRARGVRPDYLSGRG